MRVSSQPGRARTPLIIAVAVLACAVGRPALAQQPTDTEQVQVAIADLNLASRQGQATLHRRVLAAVATVCGGPGGTLTEREAPDACRKVAYSDAMRQVQLVMAAKGTAVASNDPR